MSEREVVLRSDAGPLGASFAVPGDPRGIVIFAHGSGSSRFSSRNRFVARELNEAGFATLLMDLLTADEDRIDRSTAEYRFNVTMLAERLVLATEWAAEADETRDLPAGYFGASTGAAAALMAAVRPGNTIGAVVSRGGRPDLAGISLEAVRAATLLIVGGADDVVIDLNRRAQQMMRCTTELVLVEGAGHLFEEPGALERVAELAADWFSRYL